MSTRKQITGSATIIFTLLICIGLLIYFGVTLVHPYVMTLDFRESQCTAVNTTDSEYRECQCSGRACSSVYPCKTVTVTYQPSESQYRQYSVISQYYNNHDNTKMCAATPCDSSPQENERLVADFIRVYGSPGARPYTCLYNPNNPQEVILEKTSRVAVAMAMLWPSVVFVGLIAGVIIYFLLCSRDARPSTRYYVR